MLRVGNWVSSYIYIRFSAWTRICAFCSGWGFLPFEPRRYAVSGRAAIQGFRRLRQSGDARRHLEPACRRSRRGEAEEGAVLRKKLHPSSLTKRFTNMRGGKHERNAAELEQHLRGAAMVTHVRKSKDHLALRVVANRRARAVTCRARRAAGCV